ncbi:hypothetical protein ABH945_001779 [Paraburkholderia sp. GAS333]|uniref:hypothetical protein n=1 Tax=Paraburkholderia sp. GAS333 TaxID=3156279 RepID=UPI003D1F85B6
MTTLVPVRIDRDLLTMLLRSRENAALVFGPRHADALMRLLTAARQHGQEVDVALLDAGKRQTLIARAAGANDWACVK